MVIILKIILITKFNSKLDCTKGEDGLDGLGLGGFTIEVQAPISLTKSGGHGPESQGTEPILVVSPGLVQGESITTLDQLEVQAEVFLTPGSLGLKPVKMIKIVSYIF